MYAIELYQLEMDFPMNTQGASYENKATNFFLHRPHFNPGEWGSCDSQLLALVIETIVFHLKVRVFSGM